MIDRFFDLGRAQRAGDRCARTCARQRPERTLEEGATQGQAPITGFDFRGLSPAFDGTALHACGEPGETGASLWTERSGSKSMSATITCGGAA